MTLEALIERVDGRAVDDAARAMAASQKIDWSRLTDSQQRRRIRAMYVAIRAYLSALSPEPRKPTGEPSHEA